MNKQTDHSSAKASCTPDHVLEDCKLKINVLKDKFLNATDHIKDQCNAVRNQVQLQIETQIEQLNCLRDQYFNEIDHYEVTCIQDFEANSGFKTKMKEFMNEADELSSLFESQNNIESPEIRIVDLENRSKAVYSDLEKEKFQNASIVFNPSKIVLTVANVGYINYQKTDTSLKALKDMKSVNFVEIFSEFNKKGVKIVKASPTEFIAIGQKSGKMAAVKFNTRSKIVWHVEDFVPSCVGNFNLKFCKFDSKIYFYLSSRHPSSKLDNTQFSLLKSDLNLEICSINDILDSLSHITANQTGVYGLHRCKLSISMYDSNTLKLKRTTDFVLDNQYSILTKFDQMEAFESNLFLLTGEKIFMINEFTGALVKVVNVGQCRFKCIDADCLLLHLLNESKFKIYNTKRDIVYQEKQISERVELVIDEPGFDLALYASDSCKIYC
jgi:hypothetical protein